VSFDAELKLMQAIERVRELHFADPEIPGECKYCSDLVDPDFTGLDWIGWPCATIQALDGEQE